MTSPERASVLLQELGQYMRVTEVQVIDFSVRARYGPWLKVRVEDDGLLDGLKPGERFYMMLVKVMEDDMPATPNPEDRKPYKLSQMAGMLCNQEDFWQWITEAYETPCSNKDEAATWLRGACNVESRSEFDSDPVAGDTFRRFMKEFDDYKQGKA